MTSYVYRHFTEGGELLYVGVSDNVAVRSYQHARKSPWWGLVAHVAVEAFDTRDQAELAEARAILSEQPTFNRAGRSEPPALLTYVDTLHECSRCIGKPTETLARLTSGEWTTRGRAFRAIESGELHGHQVKSSFYVTIAEFKRWLEFQEVSA